MPRAGLYARVSLEEQAEGGYSLDEQLEAMRRHAATQGWVVVSEYVDPGFSGSDDNRPAFQRMLTDAETGRLDVIVVHKLDRGFRDLEDQLRILKHLGQLGVAFVSIVEQFDASTPQGKLAQNVLGAFNQYYLDNLRQETKKGKRGRAKSGRSNASTPPYGYRRNEQGEDMIDPQAAPAVKLAFESYATGNYSDGDVARILNQAGYPASGRAESRRWTREAVRYMLTNPFYAGWVRYGSDLFAGRHEPLIEQDLWDQVQAMRRKRHKGGRGVHANRRVYLLAGLARCHRCQLPLVAEAHPYKGQDRLYLRDVASRRGFDCPVGGKSTRTEPLDAQVGALVQALVLPDDWRARVLDLVGRQDQQEQIKRERARLTEKLRRLQRAYLEVEIDEAAYRRERAETRARLDALVVPEEGDILQAGQFLETLAVVWAEATLAERRDLLRLLLEAVWVDVASRRVVCVQPKPAFVTLFQQVDGLVAMDDSFYFTEWEDR